MGMRSTRVVTLAALLAGGAVIGAGCKDKAASTPPPAVDGEGDKDEAAKAPDGPGDSPGGTAAGKDGAGEHDKDPHAGPISWIEDDYKAALAKARDTGLPLVIDMGAPWCHTCLSMDREVLVDPSLAPVAERFVWAKLDTDKEVNAPVVAHLAIAYWPTYYVVTPGADDDITKVQVQARHIGAATPAQFRAFVTQGEQGHLDTLAKGDKLDPDSPIALLRDGDRAMAERDYEAADEAYTAALEAGGKDWPRRPEVLVSLTHARVQSGDWEGCVDLALAELDGMAAAGTPSAADLSGYANECAGGVSKKKAEALRAKAEQAIRAVLASPDAAISIDDRGEAMRILREIVLARGNEEEAKKIALEHIALLEKAAKEAPDAIRAWTYMWRAEPYVFLGRAAEYAPELEKLVAQLPDQYDPAYRLAWVYMHAGQPEKGMPHAEKALTLAYGPRKGRVHTLIADLHKGMGNHEAEVAARKAAVAHYESLPPGHAPPGLLEDARKALAAAAKP